MERLTIIGTGLIGASVGLALREQRFGGAILGWDKNPAEGAKALSLGAIDVLVKDPVRAAVGSDAILLAGPVFAILEWIDQLGPLLGPHQLVTDVGSVKGAVSERAALAFNGDGQARFLPGHPMAGKEVHGAEHAEAALFEGAVWLFTPLAPPGTPARTSGASANSTDSTITDSTSADSIDGGAPSLRGPRSDARGAQGWEEPTPRPANVLEAEWRSWVAKFGCRTLDLDAIRHDELCAWVSHLPQFVATAMSALLEDKFAGDEDLRAIGGRALREMTRLGASPYSMWRDVAHTNTEAIAETLLALEQRLAHLREHLKTPELREEFELANRFRAGQAQPK
jgi:prephenate dehydrogenase